MFLQVMAAWASDRAAAVRKYQVRLLAIASASWRWVVQQWYRWIYRAQHWLLRPWRWVLGVFLAAPATISSVILAGIFAYLLDGLEAKDLKVAEVSSACAQIAGTVFALLLSLSVIPAQKAAEQFSVTILFEYAHDRTLLWTIGALIAVTLGSLALALEGTRFAGPHILVQLYLMGAALDACVVFYRRALQLLQPTIATKILEQRAFRHLHKSDREVRNSLRGFKRMGVVPPNGAFTENQLLGMFHVVLKTSDALLQWSEEFAEMARKAISRREHVTIRAIAKATVEILGECLRLMAKTQIAVPSVTELIQPTESRVSQVTGRLCEGLATLGVECIREKLSDAAVACVEALGNAVIITLQHDKDAMPGGTTLSSAPISHFRRLLQAACAANEDEPAWRGAEIIERLFRVAPDNLLLNAGLAGLRELATEHAVHAYMQPTKQFIGDPPIRGLLHYARRLVPLRHPGIELQPTLDAIFALLPLYWIQELARQRGMSEFPPFSVVSEDSLLGLVASILDQIEAPDPARPRRNPTRDFSDSMSLLKRTIRQSMQGVQIPQVTSLSQGQRMLQRMVLLCMQQANDDGRPVVRTAIAVEIGALIRLLPIYLSTTRNAFSISQTIQAVALSGMLSIEQKLDAPAIDPPIATLVEFTDIGVAQNEWNAGEAINYLELLAAAATALGLPVAATAQTAYSVAWSTASADQCLYDAWRTRRNQSMDIPGRHDGVLPAPEPEHVFVRILRTVGAEAVERN